MLLRSSIRFSFNIGSINLRQQKINYLPPRIQTPIAKVLQQSSPFSQSAMGSQKIVLITGANDGIGYEAVKALLESDKANYHVLLGSRSLDKGKAAVERLHEEVPKTDNTVEVIQLDVTSDESIQKAFEHVEANFGHLDSLINNAGSSFDIEYIHGKVGLRECFNKAYDVNVSGAHVTSYIFTPLLLKSSDPRLLFIAGLSQITVASQKYFPTPPLPAGWPKQVGFETIGYRSSKTALNMVMLDWNHKLKADGVKVWGVGPGMLATNLGGLGPEKVASMGGGHPSIGGKIIRSVVEGERDAEVGKLVGRDKEGNDNLIPF